MAPVKALITVAGFAETSEHATQAADVLCRGAADQAAPSVVGEFTGRGFGGGERLAPFVDDAAFFPVRLADESTPAADVFLRRLLDRRRFLVAEQFRAPRRFHVRRFLSG